MKTTNIYHAHMCMNHDLILYVAMLYGLRLSIHLLGNRAWEPQHNEKRPYETIWILETPKHAKTRKWWDHRNTWDSNKCWNHMKTWVSNTCWDQMNTWDPYHEHNQFVSWFHILRCHVSLFKAIDTFIGQPRAGTTTNKKRPYEEPYEYLRPEAC
jgi:hypothetical protein